MFTSRIQLADKAQNNRKLIIIKTQSMFWVVVSNRYIVPFTYSKCASLIIIISRLDVCIHRDVANDDTIYLTQDMATMRQHNTISITTTHGHIFEFPFKSIVARREKKRRWREMKQSIAAKRSWRQRVTMGRPKSIWDRCKVVTLTWHSRKSTIKA